MSMTLAELKKESAEIRDMQTESGNTAKKVGAVLVGTIEYAETQITTAQTTANNAAKAADTTATAIETARAELLKRIKGISDSSNGYTDPFINGGTYEDTDTMLAAVAAHPLQTESESSKYAGNVRYDAQGVICEVHNHPIHYDSSEWVQSISAPLALKSDGTLVLGGHVYATFFRYHNADGWTAWEEIEAKDTTARTALNQLFTVDDLGTFTTTADAWKAAADVNTTLIKLLVGIVSTVEDFDLISRPRILAYRAASASRGYATSAIINQHTYYDFTALGTSGGNADILIWQYLLAEGKTGKSYKRCITHNVTLAVNTDQDSTHCYYYITALNSTTVGSWTAA